MAKFKNSHLLLKTNQRAYFGDSNNKHIYFDGTNLIISDAVVGGTTINNTNTTISSGTSAVIYNNNTTTYNNTTTIFNNTITTFTSAGSAAFYGPVTFNNSVILQILPTLPSWTIADEGRIVYIETDDKLYYGTSTEWTEVGSGAGGSGGLTTIKTSTSITTSANYRVEVDSDAGPITITLPLSGTLTIGDIVEIEDYTSNAETNNITINNNGSPLNGVDENAIIDIDGALFRFLWVGNSEGWKWMLDGGIPNKILHRRYHTETAIVGQTDFDVPWYIDTNQADVVVYIDGVKQVYNSSFTFADSNTVRFSEALNGGEIVEFASIDITAMSDIGNLYSITGDTKVAATSGGAMIYGSLVVSGGTTLGDIDLTGSLELENTTTSTTGVIYKGANRFIHNFHHPTGDSAVPSGLNTFIGLNAGNFTMGSTATETYHGSYNIGVGRNALYSNTTGYSNIGVGANSLYSNTTGYYNVGVGRDALYSNTTGYSNIGVGLYSGKYITGGSNPNQTSNTSVYLGESTKASADGNANEIVIGYDTTGNGSNTVTLGNSSITKTILKGNVGIDESDPDEKLEINGNVHAKSYFETVNTLGSIGGIQDIDLNLGGVATGTVNTSATFTFSNPPLSGVAGSFTLMLTNGGSQTVNFPANVNWEGGTTPSLTTSGTDILEFLTVNGGTIWYGFTAGLDMK